jgi:MFS family permease
MSTGLAAASSAARTAIAKAYLANGLKNLQFFGSIAVPFFIDWLRIDFTRAFLLQAWFLFWVSAMEIPTGIIADKFGRKLSVALGCLLFGADMAFFGLSTSYPLLFLAEFIGAVGMTLISGAEQALLYDTLLAHGLQEDARHYFSRYEAAGNVGLLLSFPLGSYIATLGAYPELLPVPFVMTAASGVLAAGGYLWMGEPARVKPTEGFLRMGVRGLRTLFEHRELRGYVLNAVTISSVTFFAFWFYQPVAQRAGLPVRHLGWLAAGFNIFSTLLLANSVRLERALGTGRLLLVTATVPAVLYAALGPTRNLTFVVAAFFVIVGCKMVRMPVLNALINARVESKTRATVISSMSLVERLVTFLLYPVIGALMDRSLDYGLYALALLCALFAVATMGSANRLPRQDAERDEANAAL